MQKPPVFRPSFGNRPDRIIGRDEVIGRIMDGLQSFPGSRDRATLVTGQRGMGKTALLMELADQAEDGGLVVVRTTCGDSMLENIIDALQRKGERFVAEKKLPVEGFSAGALGFSVGLTFTDEARASYGFRTKIEMICDRLAEAGREMLLLVDEVQPGSAPLRELATAYQELAGDGKGLPLVLAGLPSAVSGVVNEKTLTFLERASKINLGPVAIGAVRAYYSMAFEREGRVVSGEMLTKMAEATEGFPYLLQLIGYYAVEYTSHGGEITQNVFEQVKTSARLDLEDNVYKAILRPLSHGDVEFLRAMAQDEGPSRVADVEWRLQVSQGHAQTYRRRLLDAGVVESPARGELDFAVPGLREYVRIHE